MLRRPLLEIAPSIDGKPKTHKVALFVAWSGG